MRVKAPTARDWYAAEAVREGWSVRALDRQISTLFYERLLSSREKEPGGRRRLPKSPRKRRAIHETLSAILMFSTFSVCRPARNCTKRMSSKA
jgi:predicted nuclease of restriction endonuclease-like (RecB) superfamily